MQLLIAQFGTQPPITVNVPAPVVNNTGNASWVQPIAVILAGVVAALFVHLLTQRRERIQKLREGYSEFAAEAHRLIRFRHLAAEQERTIIRLSLQASKAQGEDKIELESEGKSAKARHVTLKEEEVDALHRVRCAECKLVMLLGLFDDAIQDVRGTYLRLRMLDYRTLPGTKPIPHSDETIESAAGIKALSMRTANLRIRIENMRSDIEDWLSTRSRDIANCEPWGRLRISPLAQPSARPVSPAPSSEGN